MKWRNFKINISVLSFLEIPIHDIPILQKIYLPPDRYRTNNVNLTADITTKKS